MKINTKLLPIKLHYFFFMAAVGPILPQLPLFGKDLGISPVVMGTITGMLPFTFLITKPIFGLAVDVWRNQRKTIFTFVILLMTISFGALYFLRLPTPVTFYFQFSKNAHLDSCPNATVSVLCNSSCLTKPTNFAASVIEPQVFKVCFLPVGELIWSENFTCDFICTGDSNLSKQRSYELFTFWSFIMLMSVGTIGFNIVNSISDAICFDVVDNQNLYGKQRLWGSIGFGITALIAGYVVDFFSNSITNYAAAYITMLICCIFDLLVCFKLKLPVIEAPKNIFKDLKLLFTDRYVKTFIVFTVFIGMLDGVIIYFLFWYLEDLSTETHTPNVKLMEGLILAAGCLGAEVIFFFISGKILQRLGHVHCFTLCFFNYSLRLGLIALVTNPWWILPIELFLQGPTFALSYTTIAAYANEIAPVGMSATMQGIAAGMGDGTGYALGSVFGGVLYRFLGGRMTFVAFMAFGLTCGVLHFVLHKTVLKCDKKRDYETLD
ncbi:major facilitator superfamily domain-containing protein 6-A-like [Tribolium madens]|uniref:major facilitator superfamily domain-containing protein 6-A-like n=1 Tax=Tribolium madens TaxID=41895 RepID=UPI001CF721FF|nr:major facilitator superfamily domain-containing protein 6-A-like [Tribolium madens]